MPSAPLCVLSRALSEALISLSMSASVCRVIRFRPTLLSPSTFCHSCYHDDTEGFQRMNVCSCQYHQQSALLFTQWASNLDGQNGGYLGVNVRDVTDEGRPVDQHRRRRRRRKMAVRRDRLPVMSLGCVHVLSENNLRCIRCLDQSEKSSHPSLTVAANRKKPKM